MTVMEGVRKEVNFLINTDPSPCSSPAKARNPEAPGDAHGVRQREMEEGCGGWKG